MDNWIRSTSTILVCLTFFSCGTPEEIEGGLSPESTRIPQQSAANRTADERLFRIHKDWLGTPWEFSGTTQVPGEGAIACGYFVTTTLRDAGLDVDRVRLAQAASETMILEIADSATVRRFSDRPLSEFLDAIRAQGEGYYIVGLDSHTGFLKVEKDGRVTFIHSGPGRGVVFEEPEGAIELSASRYRVTGKITWPSEVEYGSATAPSPPH